MSRKLINTKFYNKKNKDDYFDDSSFEASTKYSDKTCFNKIAKQEQLLGKDLYEFDEKEVMDFFTSGFTNSYTTASNYHSVFKRYVRWSIEHGIKKININPFDTLKLKKDIWPIMEKLEIEKICLTEDEIWKMADEGINSQDVVCMIPAFYGIRGIKCSELINFKKGDIDNVKNTVTLSTKVSTKIIQLPPKIIEIFKKAIEQNIYKRRGKPGYGKRITTKLMESEYVIRPSTVNGNGYIGAVRLAQRCKELLEDAGYPNMCIDDIYVSGKLNLLKHKQQQKGKIEIEDYRIVQSKFGDNPDNYDNIKTLYELAVLNEKFNAFSKITLWDEIYVVDNKDIFLYENDFSYENENEMNNPGANNLSEGGTTETHVTRTARSKKARDRCIEIYGAKCNICEFNFEETYGEIGKGLIHVHHLNQLSENTNKHVVNAMEDLRPVCPNCHLIIHRRKEPFSIEEVIDKIKNNKITPNNVLKIKKQSKLTEAI